ncbi:NADH-quinone oxidoreductase subunit NuoH [Acidithiobacillus sulfurivorans]|uniref:NADH-quinone oxidoreductase subunit H n=1 Tax=Acidithiobacillus sulfurivorans TaxID=1958756 RepID=A0ABS6A0A0_9PROT|nr:NADH-quinone oxidoreductase subunit NuoH [Acidithiobacillus sulfurivorans]MBU2760904.1 NADH-quinone oxidoreductase subunit NuoH [Acidithiobacillus sulfurivorans]
MRLFLMALGMLFTTLVLLGVAGFLVFAERRVLGFLQNRLGPNRLGPLGIGQALADALKLMSKENFVPDFADPVLYRAAPVLVAFSALASFAVVPLDHHFSWAGNWNIGLLFILAMSSLNAYGVFLGGWASGNKFSLLGAVRAVAQLVSYELPMGLALLGVVLLSGSLSLNGIVAAQNLPYIVLQPLGFVIFLIAGVAETHRLPFDLPEAESELVAGFNTEYGGMRFGYFFLGEYLGLTLIAVLTALLYLGGWHGPWLPGWIWLLIKTAAVIFVFFWLRATLPRPRYDQLMALGWKVLLPLALFNVLATALAAALWRLA